MAFDYTEFVDLALEQIAEFGRMVTITTPPPEGSGSAFDPATPTVVRVPAVQTMSRAREIDGQLVVVSERVFLIAGDIPAGNNSVVTDGIDRSVRDVEYDRPGPVTVLTRIYCEQ